jgi:hypothetical protein
MVERHCISERVDVVPGYNYGGPDYYGTIVTEWTFEYNDGEVERVTLIERVL